MIIVWVTDWVLLVFIAVISLLLQFHTALELNEWLLGVELAWSPAVCGFHCCNIIRIKSKHFCNWALWSCLHWALVKSVISHLSSLTLHFSSCNMGSSFRVCFCQAVKTVLSLSLSRSLISVHLIFSLVFTYNFVICCHGNLNIKEFTTETLTRNK